MILLNIWNVKLLLFLPLESLLRWPAHSRVSFWRHSAPDEPPVGHLPQNHHKAFILNPPHLKIQITRGSDPTDLKTWMSWFLETFGNTRSSFQLVFGQHTGLNQRITQELILTRCLGVHKFLATYCMCTLIPALRRSSSVGQTSACSWSSTPVRHRCSISLARLSTTAATFRVRSWILNFAWL